MGMMIFEKSGVFNPAAVGLSIGDMIQVIAVGGGASGAAYSRINADVSLVRGNPGEASSFGAFLSALGGTAPNNYSAALPQSGCMGVGGDGPGLSSNNSITSAIVGFNVPGAGAGGFEPGWPIRGGQGGNAVRSTEPAPAGGSVIAHHAAPTALGGMGRITLTAAGNDYYRLPSAVSQYANQKRYGNRGAGIGGNSVFSSGNGYGAGSAGGNITANYSSMNYYGGAAGGNAGSYEQTTIILDSMSAIPVTVGLGGAATIISGTGGFNSGKGADGVVIVFW